MQAVPPASSKAREGALGLCRNGKVTGVHGIFRQLSQGFLRPAITAIVVALWTPSGVLCVSLFHRLEGRQGTCCVTNSSLGRHASLATVRCEALPTTSPARYGLIARSSVETPSSNGVEGPGWLIWVANANC